MKWLLIASIVLYLFGSFRRPVLIAALFLQLLYMGLRGIELGRLPLIGPQDTLTFFSASIGLMALPFLYAGNLRSSSSLSWATGCMAGLFAMMALPFPTLNMPLPPILDTYWFELHVVLAFFAYALFGIGAVLAGMFLYNREKSLLDLQYKTALIGYSFFSASMVSGGIWGYYAWGTYWLWTPKELWTSILWLFYSLYLHLRLKGSQWDRIVAWAAILGFGVALFTYLGVSMLMKSSHSF